MRADNYRQNQQEQGPARTRVRQTNWGWVYTGGVEQGELGLFYDNVNVTLVLAKNIGIDIKNSSFILFLKLEVFTSVPPDSVSIVHYRHRVSCFLEPKQPCKTHEV